MAYRILIADDDKDIRSVLRLYLEDAGYEVLEAADGIQTLQVLEGREIDLCLLDIMMPELDGYQVLKHVREAVARVNTNIRRAKGALPQSQSRRTAPLLRCRDLELDPEACTLTRSGQPIELTSVEYRIMDLLMQHPGRVFTKQQIYECGWEEDYIAAENSVMVCMSKLRSKLADDPQAYIKTIRGLGYRLEK